MENLVLLLNASFALVNLPFTIMLIVVVLYWMTVIVGALDVSVLDFDLDLDADADLDFDADADLDVDAEGGDVDGAHSSGEGLRAVLRYLNMGEVPVTIVVTFFVLSSWTISVLANWYLNRSASVLFGLLVFVPNVLVSAHIAKYAAVPFRAVFRQLDKGTSRTEDMIGKRCTVTTTEATESFGRAAIEAKGPPIILNVRTENETLKKGDGAVIVAFNEEAGVYIISKLEMEV